MKRLFKLALIFIMALLLAACGSNEKTAQDKLGDGGQVESSQTVTGQGSASGQVSGGKGIVCESYEAYSDAWNDFGDYIVEQSGDHEIVSVHQSTAMPLELKNLNYLLPLSLLGQSVKSTGKFDVAMESSMLQGGWAEDVEFSSNPDGGYLLKGTDTKGSRLEIKVRYDETADSLRLEGYKDSAFALLFEYSKMAEGYAAQYHFVTVTGFDKATPVEGLCTYRIIFAGTNGSCARFDNVSAEPDSIFGSIIPDAQSFIDGATHWFTITEGQFTGMLGGKTF